MFAGFFIVFGFAAVLLALSEPALEGGKKYID